MPSARLNRSITAGTCRILTLTISLPQPINYDGFKLFMETYLEVDMPEDLCRHLFLSFVKKTPGAGALAVTGTKDLTGAVAATTKTACAPITGSHGNLLDSGQSEGLLF